MSVDQETPNITLTPLRFTLDNDLSVAVCSEVASRYAVPAHWTPVRLDTHDGRTAALQLGADLILVDADTATHDIVEWLAELHATKQRYVLV